MRLNISLIAAVSENNVIGAENKLLWHLPTDMDHFKKITMGHPVIMGRKTFESIGKPLKGRKNIVVSRQADYEAKGCTVVHSLQRALELCKEAGQVFIIGGGEIYRQALPVADRIHLTRIYKKFEGDTFFPTISLSEWRIVHYEKFHADDKNPVEFSFSEYERVY